MHSGPVGPQPLEDAILAEKRIQTETEDKSK